MSWGSSRPIAPYRSKRPARSRLNPEAVYEISSLREMDRGHFPRLSKRPAGVSRVQGAFALDLMMECDSVLGGCRRCQTRY